MKRKGHTIFMIPKTTLFYSVFLDECDPSSDAYEVRRGLIFISVKLLKQFRMTEVYLKYF